MTVRPVAIAAIGLLLAAFGQATPGTPIQGTEVGLEGDPGSIAAPARTDARGEAVLSVGPGRYSVFLTDPSAPAVVTVTPVNDAPSMTSAPIRPGRGRVYAVDPAGRRLTLVVPRGGRIRVTLTVWDDTDIVHRQADDGRVRGALTGTGPRTTAPPAPGGESGPETGEARATVNSSGGVIAAETSTPVNGIGGTGGGRLSNRGRSDSGETRATVDSSGAPVGGGLGGGGSGRMSNRGQSETGETPATVASSGGRIDILAWSWGRIDRLNTAEACTARRGVVLMHEGVQQCRLPATARREEAGSALGQVPTTR